MWKETFAIYCELVWNQRLLLCVYIDYCDLNYRTVSGRLLYHLHTCMYVDSASKTIQMGCKPNCYIWHMRQETFAPGAVLRSSALWFFFLDMNHSTNFFSKLIKLRNHFFHRNDVMFKKQSLFHIYTVERFLFFTPILFSKKRENEILLMIKNKWNGYRENNTARKLYFQKNGCEKYPFYSMSQRSSRFRYIINLTPNYTKVEENPKRPVHPTTVGSCS